MKSRPGKRLLEIAALLAERSRIDWEQELPVEGEDAETLKGLKRLASVQAAFAQVLSSPGARTPEDGPEAPLPFQWGHLEVRQRLGTGSNADVYRAYDPLLDREVALKLLRGNGGHSTEWLSEARRLARVRHPNVLVIYGVDTHNERPGLWTDLVRGPTLEERLAESGPTGIPEACYIGIELCRALAAVHAAGIVHGDVKAANVLREKGGRLVLTDFGSASEAFGESARMLQGTPLTMAPELFDGTPPSPASDIYSLGVLLFRCVTGSYPVDAEDVESLRDRHALAGRTGELQVQAPMPADFREVLEGTLAPRPAARIDDARALERLLIATLGAAGLASGADVPAREAPSELPVPERLLGRDAELGTLKAEFRRSRMGAGFPVIVHGDPGVGKSYLAFHFGQWAEHQGARVFHARFHEDDEAGESPYRNFLDLLWSAGRESPPADEIPPGTVTRAQPSVHSVAGEFIRLSREQPLVMIFDDLQWASDTCRDVIGHLMRSGEGESLMLIGLARSEDMNRDERPLARWLSRQAAQRRFTTLPLEPFDESRFRAVLRVLLPGPAGTSDIPPAEIRRLFELSGGNPYFLVELLRLLVARGTLAWEQRPVPGWRWQSGDEWSLPDTLVMAARAKLGALPEATLGVLQGAAVLGDEFRAATLERLVTPAQPGVERCLDDAVRHGLLTVRGIQSGCDYGFRHSLVRQVILQDLAPARRRKLHAAAADALCSDDSPAPAAALSWHCEAGERYAETVRWSLEAWRAARQREQWSESMRFLDRARRALECLEAEESLEKPRLDVMLGLAESAWHLGQLKRSRDCADASLALARHAGDNASEAAALLQQAHTAASLGHYRAAERAAESAADIYIELQDGGGIARSRMQLAAARTAMGNYRSATQVMQQILERSRDAETIDAANGQLGWALALQGRFAEAVRPLRSAVAGAERLGRPRDLAVRLRRLHWVHLSIGEFGEAYALARRAYELARSADDAFDEAKSIMGMGQARLGQGLCGEAIAYLRRTLDKLQQVGDSHCEAETLWLLGRAHGESGQLAPARELLNRALAMVREIGDRDDEFRFLADLGRVELAAGRAAAALAHLSEAATIATELGSGDGLGLCRAERANALTALGRREDAREEARSAVALLEESGSAERWRGHWALGRALLAGGAGTPDRADAVSPLRRAVDLLERIREQMPAQDAMRRRELTLLRAGPAADLAALLREGGHVEEVACLEDAWDLPGGR